MSDVPVNQSEAAVLAAELEPIDAAELLLAARNIVDGMVEWMRCVSPSPAEPGTREEREELLLAARKWQAALDA